MKKHYVIHVISSENSKLKRWWKTACKRKFMSNDQWTRPEYVTTDPRKVTCNACKENMGLELLQIID